MLFSQCPPNIIGFGSQQDLIDFANQYPNCENGYVFIFESSQITDFSPLAYIDKIQHVEFRNNDGINNFDTFESTITSSLNVTNCNSITNFDGLNLDSDNLNFQFIWLRENGQLTSLNGINTDITLEDQLRIIDNPNLPFCAIQPFCEAIANPDVEVTISGNASGCASIAEVAVACQLSFSESLLETRVAVYPNPLGEKLYLFLDSSIVFETAEVYSISGQKILTTNNTSIEVGKLPSGFYFVSILTKEGRVTKKVLKH
jgi:hypothetical protein